MDNKFLELDDKEFDSLLKSVSKKEEAYIVMISENNNINSLIENGHLIDDNGKDYEVSFCTGYGGNKIFVFKDIPFVIVITAQAYSLPYAHQQVDTMMIDYILPAILETE